MTFPVVSFRGARSLRSTIWLRYGSALAALGAVAAVGFATAAATPPPPQPLALSVSFLDLMRATFDPTAAGIWGAQGAEALAEEDWLLVEKDAVELVGATTLLTTTYRPSCPAPAPARTTPHGQPPRTGGPGPWSCSRRRSRSGRPPRPRMWTSSMSRPTR